MRLLHAAACPCCESAELLNFGDAAWSSQQQTGVLVLYKQASLKKTEEHLRAFFVTGAFEICWHLQACRLHRL